MKAHGLSALIAIMGKKKPAGDSEPDGDEPIDDGDEPDDSGFDAAADELFDAIKEDDREGAKAALKAAICACK